MLRRILPRAVVAFAMAAAVATPAYAAQSLAEVQAKVQLLEEEATAAASILSKELESSTYSI